MNNFIRKASIALTAAAMTAGSLVTTMPVHAAEQPRVVYVSAAITQLHSNPDEHVTNNGFALQGDALTFIEKSGTDYDLSYTISPSGVASSKYHDEVYYRVSNGKTTGYVNAKDCSDTPVEATDISYTVELEDDVSESAKTELENTLATLPENCRLQLKGLKFHIGNGVFEKMGGNGTIVGDYRENSFTINLKPQYVSYAVLHECGHHFDFLLGCKYGVLGNGSYKISYSPEFTRIFSEEAATSGLGAHAMANTLEYFASAVSMYFTQPGTLQKNAPQTYAFVSAAMQMF